MPVSEKSFSLFRKVKSLPLCRGALSGVESSCLFHGRSNAGPQLSQSFPIVLEAGGICVHGLSEVPWDSHAEHLDFEQLVRKIITTMRLREGSKEFSRLAWVACVSHNPKCVPCSESCFF